MAPPPAVQSSSSDPLPPKEHVIFKKIVRCYEHKQYKNGLRLAKQILDKPKFAQHGETLAMKGLILNCMGKTDEAHEHVKRGLKNDLRSHVCWHVYGLIQRADKDYDGAIKAYRNALKLDQENMQILRDLALLQIQMRDLEGYRDTRYRLLTLRPTQRPSWIGYAMAYHLLGDFDMALKILKEFAKTQTPNDYDIEYSEFVLYVNMVLREAGQLNDALAHLEQNCIHIYDKLAFLEVKAELLQQLGRLDEAAKVYRQLIDRNPENHAYYTGIERCLALGGGSDDVLDRRFQLYDDIQKAHPRAAACKRLPLLFVKGARFNDQLKTYLTNGLRKGVPSLFKNLNALYADPRKTIIIENTLLSFVKSLLATERFPDDSDETYCESPTTVLWVYYFLAQHYDRLGKFSRATEWIERALEHTPTLIELLVTKAKILKHCGAYAAAATELDDAQALDTADRFVNCKCSKYMLRAGRIDDAERMAGRFTREGSAPALSLDEMQCMWYLTEAAHAHRRRSELGEALKKCHQVERHFAGIIEDQFDFHTYCLRRMTLCAYVRLLRLEDVLRKHRFYGRAALCAVKIYLMLDERPDLASSGDGGDRSGGTPAAKGERRKELRKKKKNAAKKQAAAEVEAKQREQEAAASRARAKQEDADAPALQPLDAQQLLKVEKPLDEAVKFISPLIQLGSDDINAYLLGFEVYYRCGKILPMLQCLKLAREIEPDHPGVHICEVKLLKFYDKNEWDRTGAVGEIVSEVMDTLFGDARDPHKLNERYRAERGTSLPHRLAGGEAACVLSSSAGPAMVSWLNEEFMKLDSLTADQWKAANGPSEE